MFVNESKKVQSNFIIIISKPKLVIIMEYARRLSCVCTYLLMDTSKLNNIKN